MILGSANRDPRRFVDPDSFNIFRDQPIRHFAFASGPHVCIGQHLARLEMKRALNAILDRMPTLRLDPDMPPPRIKGLTRRVPKHLYIRCD
jgi:cytochrome P450